MIGDLKIHVSVYATSRDGLARPGYYFSLIGPDHFAPRPENCGLKRECLSIPLVASQPTVS